VGAVVTTTDGEPVDVAALRSFCRQHLASFKVPAQVRWIEEMPYNPSGKILKRVLRTDWAAAGQEAPTGDAT
jgi:fatty-acyl-CoA synthase